MSPFTIETVQSVRHWTDTLFSFTATRSPSLRFESGQFVMMGLEIDGRPLTRAYSVVSANYDDHLEFLSIKVPDGPLTSRLQHINAGDTILVSRKPTGTLSIIRDPATYERFERVVLVHGCRLVAELAYGDKIMEELPRDEFIGEQIRDKLTYYPTVTREPFVNRGRITELMTSAGFFKDLDLPQLAAEHDRVMLCGSPEMLQELKEFVVARGFGEGNMSTPGEYVIEKAFVER